MAVVIYAYTLALIGGIYVGLNEFNGIALILFFSAFALLVRALTRSASRRDSRRRNQAHPWRL